MPTIGGLEMIMTLLILLSFIAEPKGRAPLTVF